ncbi:amidohydrolase family protein [Pseudoclavibacter terrae]
MGYRMATLTNGSAELSRLRKFTPQSGAPWALLNVTVIDGTGGPAFGPTHVVIRDSRILSVTNKHDSFGGLASGDYSAVQPSGVREEHCFDLDGAYVLPGFIDAHAHVGAPDQVETVDYVYKLWLAHGITRVREVGSLGIPFDQMREAAIRSRSGELLAPSIHPYLAFGAESDEPVTSEKTARQWVARARERGAEGVKFFGAAPALFKGALEETRALGMGSACHHSQQSTPRANALMTARWGLGSIEHSYGQAEVMYRDRLLPATPADYNYSDERTRFAEAGKLWTQGAGPSDPAWSDFLDELIALDTTLVPTFTVYSAARDAERARNRDWVADYVSPQLARFFTPCDHRHGSFFGNWGTEEEVAWKGNYKVWMQFVRDFSLRGGRVCIGSDPGFIHSHYGFSFVDELELMREAGMQPLEVISAATLRGAELLGIEGEVGTVEANKIADLIVLEENPLRNFKVLYGNGHLISDSAGNQRRTGGIDVTIRNGQVIDSRDLLRQVRDTVRDLRN